MPVYHRLNLSATKHWVSKKRKHKKSMVYNLYNAYFRKNASYYKFDGRTEYSDDRKPIKIIPKLKAITILPILPPFSYIIDF